MNPFLILLLSISFIACGTAQQTTIAPKTDTDQTTSATEPAKKMKKAPGILITETLDIPVSKAIEKDTLATNDAKISEKNVDTQTPKAIEVTETTKAKLPTSNVQDSVTAIATQLPNSKKEGISHEGWNTLLQQHVSATGIVNYKGFIKDKIAFNAYLNLLYGTVPTADWSKNQKLAYWMNAYNAFTVKLITDNYPLKSIKDLKDPWDQRLFKIGKKWYNLNEIEHQILRKMGDPRIHFGINCASFSCPPLPNKAFTPDTVDTALEQLAIDFVNDTKRNTIGENSVQVSKIFQWFAKDFKTKGSLIDFLNQYAKIKIAPNAKKSFAKYNWALNE